MYRAPDDSNNTPIQKGLIKELAMLEICQKEFSMANSFADVMAMYLKDAQVGRTRDSTPLAHASV